MGSAIWNLTKKNLTLLVRAKSSALIVFLAPLLIILLLGLAYNTSTPYGINIGIYASSSTPDVESLISALQEQEFKITQYNTSIDDCIDDIKADLMHTCIAVPPNLKIEDNSAKEITFYLDPSKINLVWMIQQTLETKFHLQSEQISKQITAEILGKLSDTKTSLAQQSDAITTSKAKGDTAYSGSTQVKTSLSAIDLNAPQSSYNTATLQAFKENVSGQISGALAEINTSLTKLESANISSSDKSSLQSSLTQINSDLTVALGKINGSDAGSLAAIASTIASLEADLNATKNKLTSASSAVSSQAKSVDTIAISLQELTTSLNDIKTKLEGMKSNLDLKVNEATTITSPLTIKIEKVSPPSTYLNYTLPALIIMVVMFSSLLLGTTLVMMEKHSQAYIRNELVPIKKIVFTFAIYCTNLVLILIQILIILGVAYFFLPDAAAVLPALALILFLAASIFTFIGMTLGYFFQSEETGVLASISCGILLLFLSGVILPLESVSPLLRSVTAYNPFVIAEKMARQTFIFKTPIGEIWTDLALLFGYTAILFLVILIAQSLLQKKIFSLNVRRHNKI